MEVDIIPKQDLGKLETHHKEGLPNTNQYMTTFHSYAFHSSNSTKTNYLPQISHTCLLQV